MKPLPWTGTIPRDFQPPQLSVLGGEFLRGIWHQHAQRCSYQHHPNYCSVHIQSLFARTSHVRLAYKGILLFLTYGQTNSSVIQFIPLFSLYSCVSLEFEISLCERARINKVLSLMLLSNSLIQVFRQNPFLFHLF